MYMYIGHVRAYTFYSPYAHNQVHVQGKLDITVLNYTNHEMNCRGSILQPVLFTPPQGVSGVLCVCVGDEDDQLR